MIWIAAAIVALTAAVVLLRLLSSAPPSQRDEASDRPPENGKNKGGKKGTGKKAATTKPKASRKSGASRDRGAPHEREPSVAPKGLPDDPATVFPSAKAQRNDWDDDVDVTMVAELPDEIKALQKGYRSVDPKAAIAEVTKTGAKAEPYDDTAEIEIVEESLIDELLVEELLNDEDTGPNALILVDAVVKTDQGMRRPNNEDRPLSMPEHMVFGVADGMGGHAAGEVASQIAVDTIKKAFADNQFEGAPHNLWPRRGDELARSIEMANHAIHTAACEDAALNGMGTTAVALRISPERKRAYIAHVGDSRCYRIRNGELRQLTRDHTLGTELGAKGRMATHLSRSVGIAPTVEVDLMVDAPKPGDRYLLCTDGLTKMITEERIVEIASEGNLEERVRKLIDEANENGGKDNITIALVEVRELGQALSS